MSFTDQTPTVVTEKHLKLPWGGFADGSHFRCFFCGKHFKLGDVFRFIYAAHRGVLNPLVCEACDGPDALERWVARYEQGKKEFWWISCLQFGGE